MPIFLVDLASRIRSLTFAVPVLAAWQSGCDETLGSSCDGFRSQRATVRAPLPVDSIGSDAEAFDAATLEECAVFCNRNGGIGTAYSCTIEEGDAGFIRVCSYNTVCEGRRPEGWEPPQGDPNAPLLGRYFAAMAATEAASVQAFERLARELRTFGMPAALLDDALRAAAEEARHYRMTAALARRFGANAQLGAMMPERSRTLFEIAAENAREGVVRETLGAAFGWWQARHAEERAVRSVMRRIARDETSHAVLSWAIDFAARQRLDRAQCAALDAVTAAALVRTERELDADVHDELVKRAGLPARKVARALVAEARAELWA